MNLKNLLIRLLFCLPFAATVFYIHSYHGELINNAQVQWQYVENSEGKIYLALDVYAPSGIKVVDIFSNNRGTTDCWQLINYPDWYKGKEHFEKINEFQDVLHPYLPYNNDFDALYTTQGYTFLYEWRPSNPSPTPSENTIRIKYQNIGTQNYYNAQHVLGVRVVSSIRKSTTYEHVIELQILYPSSSSHKYSGEDKTKLTLNNLITCRNSLSYVLENPERNDYSISVQDEDGGVIDSLKGFVWWDSEKAAQAYYKTYKTDKLHTNVFGINFGELFRHIAAIIFMIYFVLICRYVGQLFVKWRSIVLDGYVAKLIIPVFLGIILLTYLFFVIGIFKLLYFPLLFAILLIILFLCYESSKESAFYVKETLINERNKIKMKPWRIFFWLILGLTLFYNFSYCFTPATYVDGSGDVVNSYLPNLNDYVLSHSFQVPIQNSTNGIASQAIDVLRAVVMVFIGEYGVYLLSFVYLLLIFGTIYLIGRKIFGINSMLIYLTALLFLSGNLFTEGHHLGKLSIATLSFLLISLYSVRFPDHNKNYVLAALFLGFLTSQFVFFIFIAVAYYLFVFSHSFLEYKTIKKSVFRQHIKSLMVFSILCLVFNLKLVFEVGIFCVPGQISTWLSDFFLNLNRDNDFYKYIDNNYIRNFYLYHKATMGQNNSTLLECIKLVFCSIRQMDFSYIFLFSLFFLGKLNKHKKLFFLEVLVTICSITLLFPKNNPRVQLYFLYPLIIIQFAIINRFISRFITARLFESGGLDFVFELGEQSFRMSSVPCVKEIAGKLNFILKLGERSFRLPSISYIREITNKFVIRKNLHIISNSNDSKFYLRKMAVRFFNLKVAFTIMLFLVLPFLIFTNFTKGFFTASPDKVKMRKFGWVERTLLQLDHRLLPCNQSEKWFWREVLPVFIGKKSKYEYLHTGDSYRNFDHAMLIRQYSDVTDKILIVPVRFHSHAMRHITARHALGSVIYQEDIKKIMTDLKKLNINYLSYIPIHYDDYNPFYTPIFEDDIFYKYFKLLFSGNGRMFYEIVYDGTNTQYHKSPCDVKNLPFVPMIKEDV